MTPHELWLAWSGIGLATGVTIGWLAASIRMAGAYDEGYEHGDRDGYEQGRADEEADQEHRRGWPLPDLDVAAGRDSGPHSERWSDTGSTPVSLPEPAATQVVPRPEHTTYPELVKLASDGERLEDDDGSPLITETEWDLLCAQYHVVREVPIERLEPATTRLVEA